MTAPRRMRIASWVAFLFVSAFASPAAARAFVVKNTNDAGPGSLRAAITDANRTPGLDRIVFSIPRSGVQTIQVQSRLPSIIDPVVLDATTQGAHLILLDG